MRGLAGLVGIGLLAMAGARAAQQETTLDERCELAQVVLAGEVLGYSMQWAAGAEGGIETVVFLQVQVVFKGKAAVAPHMQGDLLAFELPGGQVGEIAQWVEDVPRLQEDGRYLLWLEPHETRGWQIVGGTAGATPLKGPRHPDAPGLTEVKDVCR